MTNSNWLADLGIPSPSEKRSAVRAKRSAVAEIRKGHPWLWRDSIDSVSGDPKDGDLAVLFDEKRKFVAIGLWSEHDPIAMRILHSGKPRTIDATFFEEEILAAADLRSPLIADADFDAFRLVHGENDGLAGLVIDSYNDSLVVRLDSSCWLPWLSVVVDVVESLFSPRRVVLRTSRRVESLLPEGLDDGDVISGEAHDGPVAFVENGLSFMADLEKGQKTGHFLDQRDNRCLVANYCQGADVLDMFCNTGGFSVHCAAGGASSVCSVDISPYAIEACRTHMDLNADHFDRLEYHEAFTDDVFAVFEDLIAQGRRFDVVVVDPPSFAPNQAAVANARMAYRSLTRLATQVLAENGWLFQASCSARIPSEIFYDDLGYELERLGLRATNVIRTSQALDHPIGFEHGHYLKAQLCQLI